MSDISPAEYALQQINQQINQLIYAVGASLGSDNYFAIRTLCCDIERNRSSPKTTWHKVTESLPTESGTYWVWIHGDASLAFYYTQSGMFNSNDFNHEDVTHWAPVAWPQPPEE